MMMITKFYYIYFIPSIIQSILTPIKPHNNPITEVTVNSLL